MKLNPEWSFPAGDYRIKPDFTLPPPPPPGMKWHREDGWQEGDLPQGYRPLVVGEKRQGGDEYRYRTDPSWSMCQLRIAPSPNSNEFYRTTRPLLFTHEGKTWTYHRPGDPMPCDGEAFVDCLCDNEGELARTRAKVWSWQGNIIGWRYAEPQTKRLANQPLHPPDRQMESRRMGTLQKDHQPMSAHSTILGFLHDNPGYRFEVLFRYPGFWQATISYSHRIFYTGIGESYEAACADLAARFPKP